MTVNPPPQYYAIIIEDYDSEGSSLSCYNLSDYSSRPKCLGLVAVTAGTAFLSDLGFTSLSHLHQAYPDILLANEQQFRIPPAAAAGQRTLFPLCIASTDYEHGGIVAEADSHDAMFCALAIHDNHAQVLDWGYPSLKALKKAWNLR